MICADANDGGRPALGPGDGVFCDPSRRDDRGRLWRVEDFAPPWSFVTGLLDGKPNGRGEARTGVAALADSRGGRGGMGHPSRRHRRGSAVVRRRRESRATLRRWCCRMPGWRYRVHRRCPYANWVVICTNRPGQSSVPVPFAELGAQLGAGLLDPQVAYLTGDQLHSTPLATVFEVRQQLPAKLRALRKWVRESEIGVLEIKKRGIDVDPAVLRKQLKLDGPNSATMVISRRGKGALVAIVERV